MTHATAGCRRLWLIVALLSASGAGARADLFWVSWTGNDYPDHEGWNHAVSDPPPVEQLNDGRLLIDSSAEYGIYGEYWQDSAGPLALEPGERFVMCWGLCILDIPAGGDDLGVSIHFDNHQAVTFVFFVDMVDSVLEAEQWATFEPFALHHFTFVTDDAQTYRLYIDGALKLEGVFWDGLLSAGVSWGDIISASSVAEWDYFEYGIRSVPTLGDLNCDGAIDAFDIDPFVMALIDPDAYRLALPYCDPLAADLDGGGTVDAFDIDFFVVLLTEG